MLELPYIMISVNLKLRQVCTTDEQRAKCDQAIDGWLKEAKRSNRLISLILWGCPTMGVIFALTLAWKVVQG